MRFINSITETPQGPIFRCASCSSAPPAFPVGLACWRVMPAHSATSVCYGERGGLHGWRTQVAECTAAFGRCKAVHCWPSI